MKLKQKIIDFFERLMNGNETEEEKKLRLEQWKKQQAELQALLDRIDNDPELQQRLKAFDEEQKKNDGWNSIIF